MRIYKLLGLAIGGILLSSACLADKAAAPREAAESVDEKTDSLSAERETADQRRLKMREKFASRLELTPNQREKARVLHEKNRAEMKKIIAEMRVLKEKAKTLREQSKAEFEALLTDRQKEILAEINKERHEKMKNKRHFNRFKHPALSGERPKKQEEPDKN